MKQSINLKVCVFFIAFQSMQPFTLNAQINKGYLKNYSIIDATISSNERHRYKVKMEKDEFASFRLMQRGVDVMITTYDLNGKKIADFDSPNGRFGPEFFTLASGKPGDYAIEVKTLEENVTSGNYEITVERMKPKAITAAEKVDELLAKYNNSDAPGIAVAVVKDANIIYKRGFGMANLEYRIPITPASVFHIASVSKQFTAFSILLLEKEGKLSLDDDIRKYIPELPDYGYKITLRNLANHTSGIREIYDLCHLIGATDNGLITNSQAFKLLINQRSLNFIPGTEYEYCNSGYILLAKIVERVSGMSFAEFTSERIFKPLKMNHSFFLDDPEKIIKNNVYSYYEAGSSFKKSLLNSSLVGSTGLNTTVEDLSLWTMNFGTPLIGDSSILNKMQEKSKLNSGEIISYALGQEVREYKGLDVIFHGGGDAGYRSYILRIPKYGFSVIILANGQSFNPLDVAYHIVDYYLEDKEDKQEIKERNKPEPEINKEALRTFTGDYETMRGLIFTITTKENNLYLQINGDSDKILLPSIAANEFLFPSFPHSKISFFKANNGQEVNQLKWHLSDFVFPGKRIILKPFDKSQINLLEFAGKYYSSELQTEYNFLVKDSNLVATHNRNEDIQMQELQPDIFISNQGYFRKVEFIRNGQSQITGCKISAIGIKEIKFEKNNCHTLKY
jgi:CubicO group peptidase (beta-lactamase class C family)